MDQPIKGRGAQAATHNKFQKLHIAQEYWEGIDEIDDLTGKTEFFEENPKKIINKVDSPDIGLAASLNPYQGCEHGCIYCYARNSHEYWGWNAGLDFENKIIVKKKAPELLEAAFKAKNYKVIPVMLSGNTDCYQPAEKEFGLTRRLLQVFLKHKHPVSLITKNSLVLRDTDLLKNLHQDNLVSVNISITSLTESLRQKLEPRTATAHKRLEVIRKLSSEGIPVRVLIGPVIPGLNNHEIPEILKAAAEAGAKDAGYIMVRLNGAIGDIFTDWVQVHFPDRAEKVLNQIKAVHSGKLNDSRMGIRMRGEGPIAEAIAAMFNLSYKKYYKKGVISSLNTTAFISDPDKHQLSFGW